MTRRFFMCAQHERRFEVRVLCGAGRSNLRETNVDKPRVSWQCVVSLENAQPCPEYPGLSTGHHTLQRRCLKRVVPVTGLLCL